MHIQLAFIFATMLMYLCYIDFKDMNTLPQIHSFIALIFLSIVGVIVYLEGKERLEICIDDPNTE